MGVCKAPWPPQESRKEVPSRNDVKLNGAGVLALAISCGDVLGKGMKQPCYVCRFWGDGKVWRRQYGVRGGAGF